jgi:hypothetical protein
MASDSYSITQLLSAARAKERENAYADAVSLYMQLLKEDPLNVQASSRLMVIYRKQKNYSKELSIINKAIAAYEANIIAQQKNWSKSNRKAAGLSKRLAEHLGLLDKKGLPLYEDKVIANWKKRKETVQKKLASKKGR